MRNALERWAWTMCIVMLATASQAHGQAREEVDAALAELESEPTVAETGAQALRYFRVNPEALDQMRSQARLRAALPVLAGGYDYRLDRSLTSSEQRISDPNQVDSNTGSNFHLFNVGLLWDLRQLAFNPAEVQVFGLVGVQRDLLLEITRTYYLRRQLLLRMRLRPPEDPLALAALELRIGEFTAILDVLTGAWFSEERLRRLQRAGEHP